MRSATRSIAQWAQPLQRTRLQAGGVDGAKETGGNAQTGHHAPSADDQPVTRQEYRLGLSRPTARLGNLGADDATLATGARRSQPVVVTKSTRKDLSRLVSRSFPGLRRSARGPRSARDLSAAERAVASGRAIEIAETRSRDLPAPGNPTRLVRPTNDHREATASAASWPPTDSRRRARR